MKFEETFESSFKDSQFVADFLHLILREVALKFWNAALIEAAEYIVKKYDNHKLALEILELTTKTIKTSGQVAPG